MLAAKRPVILRELMIRDLLDRAIEVDGIHLDAKVEVAVRSYANGDMEVDSLDVGDIYIQLRTEEGFDDLIKVDQENFNARHPGLYQAFCDECERLALKRAKETPEHKWTEWEGW